MNPFQFNSPLPPLGFPSDVMAEFSRKVGIPLARDLVREYQATARTGTTAPKVSKQLRHLTEGLSGVACEFNYVIWNYRRGEGSTDLPLVFRPGAFGDDIEATDVLLTIGHEWKEPAEVLASTTDRTLLVQANAQRLAFAANRIVDTPQSRQVLADLKAGMLTGASIGWRFINEYEGDFEGVRCQIVTKAQLEHIALVDNPGCKATWVQVSN